MQKGPGEGVVGVVEMDARREKRMVGRFVDGSNGRMWRVGGRGAQEDLASGWAGAEAAGCLLSATERLRYDWTEMKCRWIFLVLKFVVYKRAS